MSCHADFPASVQLCTTFTQPSVSTSQSTPQRIGKPQQIRLRIDAPIILSYMIAGVWSFMTAKWSLGLVIYGHRQSPPILSIISAPNLFSWLTTPGTSGCFWRSTPFSKMAETISSAADCQMIYCDICDRYIAEIQIYRRNIGLAKINLSPSHRCL